MILDFILMIQSSNIKNILETYKFTELQYTLSIKSPIYIKSINKSMDYNVLNK